MPSTKFRGRRTISRRAYDRPARRAIVCRRKSHSRHAFPLTNPGVRHRGSSSRAVELGRFGLDFVTSAAARYSQSVAAAPTRRTKIVATIGPASRTPDLLRQLVDAGMDGPRLHLAHGTHDEHRDL